MCPLSQRQNPLGFAARGGCRSLELLHGASPTSGPIPGPILLQPCTRGWQEHGFDHRGVYISGKHQPWAQSVGKQQHDGAILPSTSRAFWGPQQGGWRWGFTKLTLLPKTFLGASPPRRLPPRVLSLTLSHPWAGRLLLGRIPLGFQGPPLVPFPLQAAPSPSSPHAFALASASLATRKPSCRAMDTRQGCWQTMLSVTVPGEGSGGPCPDTELSEE